MSTYFCFTQTFGLHFFFCCLLVGLGLFVCLFYLNAADSKCNALIVCSTRHMVYNSYFSACIFTVDWTVLDHTLRKLFCSAYSRVLFIIVFFVSLLALHFTRICCTVAYILVLHHCTCVCVCVCDKDCHCTYDKHKELKEKKGFKSLKLNLKGNNVCIESAYYQYLISHPSISWVYSSLLRELLTLFYYQMYSIWHWILCRSAGCYLNFSYLVWHTLHSITHTHTM